MLSNTFHAGWFLLCLLAIDADLARATPTGSTESNGWVVKPLSNSIRRSQPEEEIAKRSDSGALIGGCIAAGVMILATLFFVYLIYKQCLIRRQLKARSRRRQASASESGTETTTTTATTPEEHHNRRSFRKTVSHFFRRQVPIPDPSVSGSSESDDTSESGVSDLTDPNAHTHVDAQQLHAHPVANSPYECTPAEIGVAHSWDNMPQNEPEIPQKAAQILGLGQRAWHRRRQSTSFPPASPSRGREPPTRIDSGCTMSTLGRELYSDTLHEPAPERFMRESASSGEWAARHESTSSWDAVSRVSTPRYFIPMLQNPGPLPAGMEMQEQVREQRRVVERSVERSEDGVQLGRYSMGENKI